MNKKQKERKDKKRKEIAKKRVLSRRDSLRKQSRENLKAARLERKFRNKMDPIIKDPEKKKILEEIKESKILSKLEKNAEILKALESQYENEINQKKEFNEKLESEGYLTLSEKLNAIDKKNKEQMTEEQMETGQIDVT